jgi:predicted nuclease of predicted toxin-antitoxin system
VRIQEFSLLADENLHPNVIAFLRSQGFNVLYDREGLIASSDNALLQLAHSQNRVVITHDKDFGTLAVTRGEPMIGILFLRPGHINPRFTQGTLEVLLRSNLDLIPPFIVVAKRKGNTISIRLRNGH